MKKEPEESVDIKAFKGTVHMLLELLGRDMESANPSRDRDLLVATRDGLFRIEVAGQLFEYIKAFRELLVKHFPETAAVQFNLDRHLDVTKTAAKLSVQSFASKGQIFDLFKEFGVDMENTQMAIFAITQFIEMVRKLPIKFFVEQDNRFQIISAMQHELDKLIVLEESEEVETAEE